jgi:RNA polymerase sigma-70 factor, ECF subfamily
LYVTVQPGLLRYPHGLVGGDAEDVASQTWLQIVRDLPALRDASAAAAVLGKRPGAVRVAAHRGLRRLAARLAQDRNSPSLSPVTSAGRPAPEKVR